MATMPRRDFLKTAAATAAALAFAPRRLFAEAGAPAARVVVAHGTEIPQMLAAAVAALGGWGAFVAPPRARGRQELSASANESKNSV